MWTIATDEVSAQSLPELQVLYLCWSHAEVTGKTISVQGGTLWREGKLKMEGHLYVIIYCKLIIQAILNKKHWVHTDLSTSSGMQSWKRALNHWVKFPVTLGTILQDIFHKLEEYAKILHGEGGYLSLPFFRWSKFYLEKWNNKSIILQLPCRNTWTKPPFHEHLLHADQGLPMVFSWFQRSVSYKTIVVHACNSLPCWFMLKGLSAPQ